MSLEEERARQSAAAGPSAGTSAATSSSTATSAPSGNIVPEEDDPLLAQAIALSLAAEGVSTVLSFQR